MEDGPHAREHRDAGTQRDEHVHVRPATERRAPCAAQRRPPRPREDGGSEQRDAEVEDERRWPAHARDHLRQHPQHGRSGKHPGHPHRPPGLLRAHLRFREASALGLAAVHVGQWLDPVASTLDRGRDLVEAHLPGERQGRGFRRQAHRGPHAVQGIEALLHGVHAAGAVHAGDPVRLPGHHFAAKRMKRSAISRRLRAAAAPPASMAWVAQRSRWFRRSSFSAARRAE